jgi:ATP-dependent Clp protease adaptor protein ClpS
VALAVGALEAVRRGHAEVWPEHVLFAAAVGRAHAACDPGRAAALARARESVVATLDALGAPSDPRAVRLSTPLLRALRVASHRVGSELRSIALDDLLDALAADARLRDVIADLRVPDAPASEPFAHDGAPYRAAGAELADIVIWNDDVSTMEGVLHVLRHCFAQPEPEALHVMLTTHYAASALVGRYPAHEAATRAAQATARARAAGMPLRITVTVPGEAAPPKASFAERVRRFFANVA